MRYARFPEMPPGRIDPTRDALHAYARLLGAWAANARDRRKHWWQLSLRPSLNGLSTGVVYGDVDFELELDLLASRLLIRIAGRPDRSEPLQGQAAPELAARVREALVSAGVDASLAPDPETLSSDQHQGFDAATAAAIQAALASVTAALEAFRAGIREETSPIQVWPHHFDLSMLWLPGTRVPGQDPADEELADRQMNFGFLFGDETIPEPYFYITAYPLPDALPRTDLPAGASWRSAGFEGAVLRYADLIRGPDPRAQLLDLWRRLLQAARAHPLDQETGGRP